MGSRPKPAREQLAATLLAHQRREPRGSPLTELSEVVHPRLRGGLVRKERKCGRKLALRLY
jgi:hypothetical protein